MPETTLPDNDAIPLLFYSLPNSLRATLLADPKAKADIIQRLNSEACQAFEPELSRAFNFLSEADLSSNLKHINRLFKLCRCDFYVLN